MLKQATILFTMPMKIGDPTEVTFEWSKKAAQMARELGYNVVTVEKEATTYDNVTKVLSENQPKITGRPLIYSHWGHGCGSSLMGNTECVVSRKFSVDELVGILKVDPERFQKLVNPLKGISCPGVCMVPNDPCDLMCQHPTNVNLLRDSIVFTTACWSAVQLGTCAMKYGAKIYVGSTDLYMFTVDSMGSQNIFGNIQLEFFKSLLMGKTVGEAEQDMIKLEDSYIRKYKTVKYISLPILWNKVNRKIYGDKNITIYK